jgi:glyoxylase-like metal-dependent hydrolase (beta-lactamase superfamily II)
MKVMCLKKNGLKYTCNAYLVLGSWGTLQDVNTLVDVGTDGSIINEISKIYTGVGKKPVEKIVVTHEHFDHAGGVKEIKSLYKAKVYAFKKFEGVDEVLMDGQIIRMGDRDFEVIHTPGHSSDSICLYSAADEVLFSGDTPLKINMAGGSYSIDFIQVLERLMRCNIKTIYTGHDSPIEEKAMDTLERTLMNAKWQQTSGSYLI